MSDVAAKLIAGRPSARTAKGRVATLSSLGNDVGGMKRVNFELPAEQHAKLKIYATKQGRSIRDVLSEYVAGLPDN